MVSFARIKQFVTVIRLLIIVYVSVLSIGFSTPLVFAQAPTVLPSPPAVPSPCTNPKDISTDLGCIPTNPVGFVEKFYGIGLSLIGGVSLLFIIYGAYILLTSQGDPIKLANGKSYITYAIIGLLLAIFGYVFIKVIAVDILHIPGFN